MKKCILFTAALSAALLVSCGTEPPEPPEEQFAEVWHSTQHQIKVEVFAVIPPFMEEDLKLSRERESSVSVSETEQYRLSFREDGTGICSGKNVVNDVRYKFDFDGHTLTLTGNNALFFTEHYTFHEEVAWNIEERTSNTMVLSKELVCFFDGIGGSSWSELVTYRYTFEKVK